MSEDRRRRDRLMGNRQMRYAYSVFDAVLHDRDCPELRKIRDKDFYMLEDFCPEMELCPLCANKALVRSAIGDDVKHLDAYVGTLKRFGARMVDLQEFILKGKGRFAAVDIDSLCVELGDDRWIICREDGVLHLYHNNYEVIGNFERIFREGYHLQGDGEAHSFRYYVNYICTYSWQEHVELMKAEALERKKAETRAALENAENMICEKRGLIYIKFALLDCDRKALLMCRKRGLALKVQERIALDTPYEIIRLRIPRWKKKALTAAMDELKEYSVGAQFWDYAEKCAEIKV
ncbi:MAG: hypothetical protein IJY96_01715 [Oscillospiraceae bacterium]|nr:hypothetical protein [Oscillospiraceae bacterium]